VKNCKEAFGDVEGVVAWKDSLGVLVVPIDKPTGDVGAVVLPALMVLSIVLFLAIGPTEVVFIPAATIIDGC
jgi:hypothetical protein